ncbi:unnamed protein product [Meganyctiphanes norvegica]|uniref:Uncharacterized protein n=1 Tax=Meganyctiphanes norvegica TaxID=48144 RepID=A0AAV2RF13_MEGNR
MSRMDHLGGELIAAEALQLMAENANTENMPLEDPVPVPDPEQDTTSERVNQDLNLDFFNEYWVNFNKCLISVLGGLSDSPEDSTLQNTIKTYFQLNGLESLEREVVEDVRLQKNLYKRISLTSAALDKLGCAKAKGKPKKPILYMKQLGKELHKHFLKLKETNRNNLKKVRIKRMESMKKNKNMSQRKDSNSMSVITHTDDANCSTSSFQFDSFTINDNNVLPRRPRKCTMKPRNTVETDVCIDVNSSDDSDCDVIDVYQPPITNSYKNEMDDKPRQFMSTLAYQEGRKQRYATYMEGKQTKIDEDSKRGRFGWCTLYSIDIPYILREGQEYCSIRMMEHLLKKYLTRLPEDNTDYIYSCGDFITSAEAKLLTEINSKHCEKQFGRESFTTRDQVVKLENANNYCKFVETCLLLLLVAPQHNDFCGFVKVNNDKIVPYTIKDMVKYVHLSYFLSDTDSHSFDIHELIKKTVDGWELEYLKFCATVLCSDNEYINCNTIDLVSLDEIKQCYSTNSVFEDWWPAEVI